MSTPHRYIVVRQSPDWLALTPAEFEAQARAFCRMIGEPEESVVDTARLWDRTFAVSFLETRAAMKEIALDNLRQVRGATLLFGYPDAPPPRTDEASALYFFSDDDDWAHPDLFQFLEQAAPPDACDGYVWPHISFGQLEGKALRVRKDEGRCCTNNYAVTATYARRGPDDWRRVYQHYHAHETFPALQICRVRPPISATNKNPSSTMFTRRNLRGEFTGDRLAENVAEFVRRTRQPLAEDDTDAARLAWVLPWGQAVANFYEELLASRR